MTRILTVVGVAAVTLLMAGLPTSGPVLGGCGGSGSGCGSSHDHARSSTTAQAQDSTGRYTCPMHPEIIRSQPGDCPKCGMALVPVPEVSSSDQAIPTYGMAVQCRQILEEYAVLQDHFEMMMTTTDVEKLGPAMRAHRNLMLRFGENLAKCEETCSRLAETIDAGIPAESVPPPPDRTSSIDKSRSTHQH